MRHFSGRLAALTRKACKTNDADGTTRPDASTRKANQFQSRIPHARSYLVDSEEGRRYLNAVVHTGMNQPGKIRLNIIELAQRLTFFTSLLSSLSRLTQRINHSINQIDFTRVDAEEEEEEAIRRNSTTKL